jgi:hypothetical protein
VGAPYLARGPTIDFGKDGVEPTQAAETGTHGDLRHWQGGFVDQALGALNAGGSRDL